MFKFKLLIMDKNFINKKDAGRKIEEILNSKISKSLNKEFSKLNFKENPNPLNQSKPNVTPNNANSDNDQTGQNAQIEPSHRESQEKINRIQNNNNQLEQNRFQQQQQQQMQAEQQKNKEAKTTTSQKKGNSLIKKLFIAGAITGTSVSLPFFLT